MLNFESLWQYKDVKRCLSWATYGPLAFILLQSAGKMVLSYLKCPYFCRFPLPKVPVMQKKIHFGHDSKFDTL